MSYHQQAFSHHNPVKVHFGNGCRHWLVDALAGKKVLVVTSVRGKRQFLEDIILGGLKQVARLVFLDAVKENPDIHFLQELIDGLGTVGFDVIVGFGGGSAIDSAKVINAGLTVRKANYTLRHIIQSPELLHGQQLLPLYAVPTTAGTGSEVTPFATVWDHAVRKKYSVTGPEVYPTISCIDPVLTASVPLSVTVSTGLDAINQAAESIWNKNATPITLMYANRALKQGFEALPELIHGNNEYRRQMAEASVLAGLAISQTRTSLCHSISYPITAHYGVPHGIACAFSMTAVLRHNLAANDGRFTELAKTLAGTEDTGRLVEVFDSLCQKAGVLERIKSQVPSLQDLMGLAHEMITPDRAGNSLVDIGGALDWILENSWRHNDN